MATPRGIVNLPLDPGAAGTRRSAGITRASNHYPNTIPRAHNAIMPEIRHRSTDGRTATETSPTRPGPLLSPPWRTFGGAAGT
jgi:hypothetical protein